MEEIVIISCRKCSRKPTYVCHAHVYNPYLCKIHAKQLMGCEIGISEMSDTMKKDVSDAIDRYNKQPGIMGRNGTKILETCENET